MNDAELLVGWDVLALPKRTRVGSIEEVRPCYSESITERLLVLKLLVLVLLR